MIVNYIFCTLLIGYWLFFDGSDIRVLYVALGFSLSGSIVESLARRRTLIDTLEKLEDKLEDEINAKNT